MKRVKVRNMFGRTGREVPNQFIIETDQGKYFQSYKSVIAFKDNDSKVTLDEKYWNYSRTTGKYRNEFLGEYIELTRDKIASGEYKLADLN